MLVTIYGKDNCIWCDKAVEACEDFEIPFIYNELDADFTIQEFGKLFPQAQTLPQILVNDIHVGGFRDFREVMEMAIE